MMTKPILFLVPMTGALPLQHLKTCFSGVEDVEVMSISQGPSAILSRADQTLSGADSIRLVKEVESAGCKAVVIGCLSDPNLSALRESVKIPVIGAMQVAMHICAMLAGRFSLICCQEPYIKRSKEDLIAQYGFGARVASIRQVPAATHEIAELSMQKPTPKKLVEMTLHECSEAIEMDGATALVFGCGVFTLLIDDIRRELKEKGYDLPVINPFYLAVDTARFFTQQGLSHSQLAFPLNNK
jgi:allantoin racemase